MKQLSDSLTIRHTTIKNAICLPPMVCFKYGSKSGEVSDPNVEHYRAIARGGAGLLIQEATCISTDGKLDAMQLGIWSDDQIAGHARIARAVHDENAAIVMQIHHAGVVGIAQQPLCPSAYPYEEKIGKEMTLEDIARTQRDFIQAARRAELAGYDGVELHGCHRYLISQFLNKRVNKRQDEYGASPMKYVTEIIDGIRGVTSDDFIVGIRLGGFEPTLEDGIQYAVALEQAGFDFINVSTGFGSETDPYKPDDFPYESRIYAAGRIKKAVCIPVFAVGNIRTIEDAQDVLQRTGVDMVDVGRSMLVDPQWANKALRAQQPGKCVGCRECRWNADRCPGIKLMERA